MLNLRKNHHLASMVKKELFQNHFPHIGFVIFPYVPGPVALRFLNLSRQGPINSHKLDHGPPSGKIFGLRCFITQSV